mmetsp:Transcript_22432/g.53168  ORF Transcript_22432/g.53168 Transcript_22432/m.53168 type:complete len:210 (-) Transcript_22432:436-1065(-)
MQPSPYLPLPALASRPPSVPLFSETVPFAGPYRYLPRLDVRLAARRNTVAVAVPTAAAATAASAARLHAALRSSSDFKRGGVPALSPLRPVKRTWRCCARMRVSPSRAGPPLPPPRWTGRRYAPCSPCSLLRARFLPPLFPAPPAPPLMLEANAAAPSGGGAGVASNAGGGVSNPRARAKELTGTSGVHALTAARSARMRSRSAGRSSR